MPLRIPQGGHYEEVLQFENGFGGIVPLYTEGVGPIYTAQLQIRKTPSEPTTLLEMSTDNGRIIINSDHSATLLLTSDVTAALAPWARAVYDMELIDADGRSYPVLYGPAYLEREVTR